MLYFNETTTYHGTITSAKFHYQAANSLSSLINLLMIINAVIWDNTVDVLLRECFRISTWLRGCFDGIAGSFEVF